MQLVYGGAGLKVLHCVGYAYVETFFGDIALRNYIRARINDISNG